MNYPSLVILVLTSLVCGFANVIPPLQKKTPAVLIVSFDGFRHDYYTKAPTPTLTSLKAKGCYSDMINVFETKTFPNHQSLATGLYPESHGVLANHVFDPLYNRILNYSKELWEYNDEVTPIWILNELEGGGRHSGVMMWPGGEFSYRHGHHATFEQGWDPSWGWERRVDTVMGWLCHPDTPANLAMLYIEEPDTHGHAFGPDSPEVAEQVRRLDSLTAYLLDALEVNNLTDTVDVFLVSDHGMASVDTQHIIDLSKISDTSLYMMVGTSPVVHIIPKDAVHDDIIYKQLKKASETAAFSVYSWNEIPLRWHFADSRRAPKMMVVADEGYAFQDLRESIQEYAHKYNFTPTAERKYGVHGYDNTVANMHPFFLAWGPSIRRGMAVPPFPTIDLFPLWAGLLRLPPTEVRSNGTSLGSPARQILVHQESVDEHENVSSILITLGCAAIAATIIGGTGLLAVGFLKKRHASDTPVQPYRKMESLVSEGEEEEEEEEDETGPVAASEERRLLSALAVEEG